MGIATALLWMSAVGLGVTLLVLLWPSGDCFYEEDAHQPYDGTDSQGNGYPWRKGVHPPEPWPDPDDSREKPSND